MGMRTSLCLLAMVVILSGCAVAAAPCRITGAVVKVVPVVGDAAGVAFDVCGDLID